MTRANGFTLIELLVSISIVVILIGAAVPAFSALIAGNEVTTARDDLMGALNLARHTAIMGGVGTAACPAVGETRRCSSGGQWSRGWLVFTDPNDDEFCSDANADGTCDADGGRLLAHVARGSSRITIRGNHFIGSGLRFDPLGHARWSHGTFSVCDPQNATPAKGIVISPSGRIRTATALAKDGLSCSL